MTDNRMRLSFLVIISGSLVINNCFAQSRIIKKGIDEQTYRTQLGEEADDVIIGDEKIPSVFKPEITFTRWNKENFLRIKPSLALTSQLSSAVVSFINNKIEYKNSKMGWYANPDPDNKDNFKFGLIFYEKPTTNTWSFQLEGWEDFDFHYTGIIEGERLWDGEQWVIQNAENPTGYFIEKMLGAWIIRHKTKRNYEIGKTNYQSG